MIECSGRDDDLGAVHVLSRELELIDAYDAAVIEKKSDGKVKIVKKHETPTRVGGVAGGGLGLATGLVIALFPAAAIGTGLLAVATAERCQCADEPRPARHSWFSRA